MKTITKLLAASAFALTMGAASAQAAVYIGTSTDGGATINQVFFQAGDGVYSWTGTNIGGFEVLDVDGVADVLPGLLHSDNVESNTSGAASVSIFVTRTDLTAAGFNGFFSAFTGNTELGDDYDVTLTTYADLSNGLWGGTQLATVSYSGFGADSDEFTTGGFDLSGTFSVTHRYDISTASGGSTSPTITLGAIPEPGTWALMIMGFGGAGAMLRSRRRQLVAA